MNNIFDLSGKVAIITGGAGFLGQKHAEAIAFYGGAPVLADVPSSKPSEKAKKISEEFKVDSMGLDTDITKPASVKSICETVMNHYGHIDILINNAANNPKVEASNSHSWSRLENFPLEVWEADLNVGLTGAFLCSQIIGRVMAQQKRGVIINVASDLALIAPDQRIYRKNDLPEDLQPVKPVTYSVIKTGLIGLTRYLATYWANDGVRVNAISPGGVYNGQPEDFVQRLSNLIPLGRMANVDEYQGAIIFLCSEASSYMTGNNLIIDGGRSCW